MDAISFVLGIKSSHLRSAHLRDLIYRGRVIRRSIATGDGPTNGNTEEDDSQASTQGGDPKSAWVMAVYEDDAGDEQRWKRTITSQGTSEYRINERVVSAQQYNESMEAENILVKARNFLVFQGDVEAIAIQKPQDLTRLIEQVSGSLEYKAEYDRLKAEYEQASDQQSLQVNRRRAINQEIRQYRELKDEADQFKRKTEDRDDAIVTHILWKLYHLQQNIQNSQVEIQKQQAELSEFTRSLNRYNRALESAKKDNAEAGRDLSKLEKRIQSQEKEIEDQESKLVPIDEQINVLTGQLSKYNNRIVTIRRERNTQAGNISQLEKDSRTVERAEAQWQRDWDATAGREGTQLNEEDLREYNRLRQEVSRRAHAEQSRVQELKGEKAPLEATYNNLRNTLESTEFKLQTLQANNAQLEQRRNDMTDSAEDIQREVDGKRRQLQTLTAQRVQTGRQRTELDEKIADVLRKLLEADDGRRASEKEMRVRETVATLKRTYPGVRGRLHELCKPKQKRFSEAVSTVLGRHFDSIVVDTEATAKQCIEYLRDQRAGQATFIPLDTIQVKSSTINARTLDSGSRLAIDTIDFDSSIARAVSYACGDAIVCETLDQAKNMVYNRRIEAKVVTLDGTVISKGGLITGGRGKQDNTRRWDDAEIERLTRLKDRWLAEISALPQDRVTLVEEQTLQQELSGLESRLRYARDEIEALNRNLSSNQAEVDAVRRQIEQDRGRLTQEQARVDRVNNDIEESSRTVRRVEDEVFADFCERHGFSDIRDYEARQGSLQAEGARKKLEFTTQRGKIQAQLSFERAQMQTTDDRIAALQDKAARDRGVIDELNERRQAIGEDLAAMKNNLDELQAQFEEQKQARNSLIEAETRARLEVQKRSKTYDATLKKIGVLEGQVKKFAAQRYSQLRRCKLENIQIPLVAGSSSLDDLPVDGPATLESQSASQREGDDDDDGDQSSQAFQAHEVADYGIEADFSELDDHLKEDDSEATEERLLNAISELNSQLEKMNPNSHATTRLEASETRAAEVEAEYRATTSRYSRLAKDYTTVKNRRDALFKKAFDHISSQIEPIYSNLTRSGDAPTGGRAFLTADSDEPYLAGVNYHTMPPSKRFRDMEHLSGGEKTMAALALLFAIHSYQPSPFFVLDEVDAALDNANVQKLVNYVRRASGPGMQFIVISLKTGFFSGSEALVGVYRDQSANSSKALTLDLRKYA